jgi:aminopeptidase-like protein
LTFCAKTSLLFWKVPEDMSPEMISWARDLFPICRSITGEGIRESLGYFERLNPEFKREIFKTGEKVFDWEIPREWNIRDAFIEHESGQRFAEFSKLNLHVVGYSAPVNKTVSKEELLEHLFTQEDQPELVPYVTSYYNERWGFCMSENARKALPDGNYKVFIDSDLSEGTLELSHALIEGSSRSEIFFSSYLCHPSMVNNELSGPVLLNAIMHYIKSEFPESNYSYRFVMLPETIGSIAYLSRYHENLKRNMLCGFNLSCVGDERAYSHVLSRKGDSLADAALAAGLTGLPNVKTYSFLERGSDERQYCAPGIDLPVCGFSRSKYGEFPEYHTNADTFDVVTQQGLEGALDVMKSIVKSLELGLYPKTSILCEPQLGKRGLYPSISHKGHYDSVQTRMDFIAYSDGYTSIFDIAKRIGKPLAKVCEEYEILKENQIIDGSTEI